jgi:hypothetical protein
MGLSPISSCEREVEAPAGKKVQYLISVLPWRDFDLNQWSGQRNKSMAANLGRDCAGKCAIHGLAANVA